MGIREAKPEDADPIAEIQIRSWQAAYKGIVPDAYLGGMSVAEYRRTWYARISAAGSQILVAESEGEITGWIAGGQSRDPDVAPATVEVFGIYVDPRHWRKGVGRTLLEAFRTRFAPNCRITLWVLEGNQNARRFYESAGFATRANDRNEIELAGAALIEVRYVRGGA